MVVSPTMARQTWAAGRCVRQAPVLPAPPIHSEQRRQAEGEAVESELGGGDARFVAELDGGRHEGERRRRGDAQADADGAALIGTDGRHDPPQRAGVGKGKGWGSVRDRHPGGGRDLRG
jgi:hypothetical protein